MQYYFGWPLVGMIYHFTWVSSIDVAAVHTISLVLVMFYVSVLITDNKGASISAIIAWYHLHEDDLTFYCPIVFLHAKSYR